MRVLFFAWTSLNPHTSAYGYGGGSWVATLQHELNAKGIELGYTYLADRDEWFKHDGYSYYAVKREIKSVKEKLLVGLNPRNTFYEAKRDETCLKKFAAVVKDFKPDVIHVFGSEQCYGLITKYTNIPVVIHLQGLLNSCWNAVFAPGVSLSTYCLQSMNPKKMWSKYQEYMEWYRTCAREREILRNCKYFIGRTDWDKCCTSVMAKGYKYFYGSEMLRTEFHDAPERIQPEKLTIVTTISGAIYKGYDMILKTAKILKDNIGDNFIWKVFGSVDPKFYEKLLGIKHGEVNVELYGVAKPSQIVKAYSNCTVYVHSSYIENSSNAIGEAQLSGCPVVACYVGGNETLVQHGKGGFLVPANDPYMTAARIIQLHKDKELNMHMGETNKITASKRHDRETIVNGLIDIYKQIIEIEK